MSTEPARVIRQAAEGRSIGIVGDLYHFLATGDETLGRYATWEAIVPPGGGPPPHVHSREVESFYVLEGEITFQVGDERRTAGPGTFVHMPIGVPHAFKNESDRTTRMLISVVPAGLEKMFFEVGQSVEPGSTTAPPKSKEEIERLLAASARYGIRILVP
jgi:mannose-6-phosphate isomerase-like protein (cupin superfamily)